MAETLVYTPEQSQANSILPWMLAGNGNWGGGLFGGAGGAAFLGGLLGGFFPNLFGWNGNWGGGNGNGAAAALGAQATANNNTDLIMNAITGTDADVRALSAANGNNFNAIKSDIAGLNSVLSSMSVQLGMTPLQIMNAIQSGNSSLANQLAQCCCENRLLTTQQGYEAQIRTIEQTNTLGSQADRNTASVVGAINDLKATTISEFCAARERDMQAKIDTQADIITQLRGQISNDRQTEAFTAAFNALDSKVTALAAKQPNTVPVQWPNLYAVNATPYVSGGYYQGGFNGLYGNGVPGFNF